jgi:hypothetical protein
MASQHLPHLKSVGASSALPSTCAYPHSEIQPFRSCQHVCIDLWNSRLSLTDLCRAPGNEPIATPSAGPKAPGSQTSSAEKIQNQIVSAPQSEQEETKKNKAIEDLSIEVKAEFKPSFGIQADAETGTQDLDR